MGMVHGTFHLYVREEVIPEPSTSGEVRGGRVGVGHHNVSN